MNSPISSDGPAAGVLAMACALILTGCGSTSLKCPDDPVAKSQGAVPDFSPYQRFPKARIGSIPCPGPFTFYATGDPSKLGTHAYGSSNAEGSRGIIYTLHGGFIDIAHTRKAADWTVYLQVRIKHALDHGWQCVVLPSREGSDYRIRFGAAVPAAAREELSIRLAQRMAITQTAWHEIATWFGYTSTLYPEKPSALTYDDMTSHILGATVAGLALHDRSRDYNSAVTYYLARELGRLGPVGPDETERALAMVDGKWWRNGFVIKRQLDLGGKNGVILPWLVPGYPGGATTGFPFATPSLVVGGQDLSCFEQVDFDPRIAAWSSMRRLLPGNPDRCVPEVHFPLLLEYIRRQEGQP